MLCHLPDGVRTCVGVGGAEGRGGGKKVWEDEAGLKPLCQFSEFTAVNFYSTMYSHPDKMNYPVMEASEK